jgi:hypothetical protein
MRRPVDPKTGALAGVALLLFALMCKSSGGGTEPAGTNGGAAGSPDDVAAIAGSRVPAGGGGALLGVSGDAGAPLEGGSPALPTWVDDQENWKEVAAAAFTKPACTISEALPSKVAFPTLSWESCGTACEAADVVQGYGTSGALPFASTVEIGKDVAPLLTFSVGIETGGRWLDLRRVVRLDSGASLGALKAESLSSLTTSPCSFGGFEESAATVDIAGGNQGDAKQSSSVLDGFAPLEGGAWLWASPAVPIKQTPGARMGFDIDLPERSLVLVGAGAVYKQKAPTNSDYETIESPSASSRGAGQGDLAVWNDLENIGQPRIRGWAPDGQGVRTIIEQPPPQSCNVVVSPTTLVAAALEGDATLFHQCSGPADAAHLWRSPRAYVPADVTITEGPALPGTPFVVGGLKTWGDYATLYVRPITYKDADYDFVGDSYLMVVELSTWKAWRVNATKGHVIQSTSWTLTNDSLYFGETDPGANNVLLMRRALRIPLADLDSYGTAL